jgi:hypothetical protein
MATSMTVKLGDAALPQTRPSARTSFYLREQATTSFALVKSPSIVDEFTGRIGRPSLVRRAPFRQSVEAKEKDEGVKIERESRKPWPRSHS